MLNSLRGWHQEFIFVRGGNLKFMPLFKYRLKIKKIHVQKLGGDAFAKVLTSVGYLATCGPGILSLIAPGYMQLTVSFIYLLSS